jgi:hypothetical protein
MKRLAIEQRTARRSDIVQIRAGICYSEWLEVLRGEVRCRGYGRVGGSTDGGSEGGEMAASSHRASQTPCYPQHWQRM